MSLRGSGRRWDSLPSVVYTETQVEQVLEKCGVEIDSDTFTHYVCYCPFHGNTDTPSMAVDKTNGKFICFNPSCSTSGQLVELVKAILKTNEFQTARFISKAKTDSLVPFEQQLAKALAPVEFKEWKYAHTIDKMQDNLFNTPKALDYMTRVRGFDETTLREYKVGYNIKRNLICVPVYTPKGIPVGVVGRPCLNEKVKFNNSPGLPTSKTLWNLHKAKRTGDSVIVVEASFDGMRVSQAGYPNVVALLGGNFSDYHAEQLAMYFTRIIIMTDDDALIDHRQPNCRKCNTTYKSECNDHNPGRALGLKIAGRIKGKQILWASYEPYKIYPNGAKDAGDMTMSEIRKCIKNAVPHYEYSTWGVQV